MYATWQAKAVVIRVRWKKDEMWTLAQILREHLTRLNQPPARRLKASMHANFDTCSLLVLDFHCQYFYSVRERARKLT